jgi:ribosomal protein S18 acetylase RimI-like enzyme
MNNHTPSSKLVTRPASFNDISCIQEIAGKTWPSAYEKVLGKQQVEYMLGLFYSRLALEEQMKNHHHFYLALQNYLPIGFTSFSKIDEGLYKLQKLYVLPYAQKTGAGRTLLETVMTIAKSMGAVRLQLNVNRKNVAKDFYSKAGFTVIKEEDIDIGNGYLMNDYVMSKTL